MNVLYEDIYDDKNQFSFGKNWQRFLEHLDEKKIEQAKIYLLNFIGGSHLIKGKTVIDFGCGSGLMSLCFVLLGASRVVSVDVDKSSIECALFLRKKFKISNDLWEIVQGSVLNENFVISLGKFDIVYSWGVIHHTGDMWRGLSNIITLSVPKGFLYIAIYNKFSGFPSSSIWLGIKKFYAASPLWIKTVMNFLYTVQILLFRALRGVNPIRYVREYYMRSNRGMDFYRDIEDWLGGYPYEFATIGEIRTFFESKGFKTENIADFSYGTGCNEFLFSRNRK